MANLILFFGKIVAEALSCTNEKNFLLTGESQVSEPEVALFPLGMDNRGVPKRGCGHPKKLKMGCMSQVESFIATGIRATCSRPRGRPKKYQKSGWKKKDLLGGVRDSSLVEGSGSLDANEGNQLMVLPMEFSEPFGVVTRARNVIFLRNIWV